MASSKDISGYGRSMFSPIRSPSPPPPSPPSWSVYDHPLLKPRAQRTLLSSPGEYNQFLQDAGTSRSPSAGPMASSPVHQSPYHGTPYSARSTETEPTQETDPTPRYYYASPGITPQVIVRGDSFIAHEDVPPEFRGPVDLADLEDMFRPYQGNLSNASSSESSHHGTPASGRSNKSPYSPSNASSSGSSHHGTPASGRSNESPYSGSPSNASSSESPHHGTPASGRSNKSHYPGSPSPARPTQSHFQRTPSPQLRTPSHRPTAARRLLFKTPSPIRQDLISPSLKNEPWYMAFGGHEVFQPPRKLLSPVKSKPSLPPTLRQTVSPDIFPRWKYVPGPRSSPERSDAHSHFPDAPRRLMPKTTPEPETTQEPDPTQKYFYASPGIIPQAIVTGDSFMVDEDVPPEFRGPVDPIDLEDVFRPGELEGIPLDKRMMFMDSKFHKMEYEKTLNDLKKLIGMCVPHVNYRGERSSTIIVKALAYHVQALDTKIQTLEAERDSLKSALESETDKVHSLFLDTKSIKTLTAAVNDLERRLKSEVEDNKRLMEKEIQLTAQVTKLQAKMSTLVDLQPQDIDNYYRSYEIQAELRARAESAEATNQTLEGQLKAERRKYERSLEYLVEAHKKMAEICGFKGRRLRSHTFGPESDPLEVLRRRYVDPSYGSSESHPLVPELVIEAAVEDIALMAEAFTQGETTPTPEVVQQALDRWHDLVVEEIEKDQDYIIELTYDKVAYNENVMKELEERDKIRKLEQKCITQTKELRQKILLKNQEKDRLLKFMKDLEKNLARAEEYYYDIKRLWENCKYKYVSAAREKGCKVYATMDGQWVPEPPPEEEPRREVKVPDETLEECQERLTRDPLVEQQQQWLRQREQQRQQQGIQNRMRHWH